MRCLVLAVVLVAACTRGPSRPPVRERPTIASTEAVRVRLIDSIGIDEMPDVFLQGVEVASATVDTIPGLYTTDLPTIVGDTLVLGLAVGIDGAPEGMFRYRVRSRRLERLALPEALSLASSGIAISPSGWWQSYAIVDSSGWGQAVIQRFPNGPILRRSPLLPLNVVGGRMADVEWRDTSSTIVYLDGFRDALNRWYRIRGDMYSGKWRVDTIVAGEAY